MIQPNPSTAQARAIVDELHRHGVDYVVISPGSRSGALAIAFEEHPGIATRVVLDERSAAFHALGRSRAGGAPAVALATSGTALANHLPAVVEADLSLVPLVLISADRPMDLLQVGANQTPAPARSTSTWPFVSRPSPSPMTAGAGPTPIPIQSRDASPAAHGKSTPWLVPVRSLSASVRDTAW
jgi:2-succinyl-5-enolpyruvyl-6-hydroxy-3-cyclohexene-1-carboxylate synthase